MRSFVRHAAVALIVAGLSSATSAAAITIPLDREFDSGSTGSYATLTLTEVGGDLDFTLSLAGTVLGAGADLHQFYFNLVGSPTGLAISNTNAPNGAYALLSNPSVVGGAGAAFEHGVSFGNGGGPPGNGVLKTASFRLSADQPLTLASLAQSSHTSGGLTVSFGLHVQGTSLVPGVDSETVGGAIPEPTTGLLLGAGLLGLARAGSRRRRG